MNPENLSRIVKTGSMDDVGTRIKFLTELYDLWETGLDILERFDKYTPGSGERKRELQNALKLLGFHMTKDYNEEEYKKVIALLPKSGEAIKDKE